METNSMDQNLTTILHVTVRPPVESAVLSLTLLLLALQYSVTDQMWTVTAPSPDFLTNILRSGPYQLQY